MGAAAVALLAAVAPPGAPAPVLAATPLATPSASPAGSPETPPLRTEAGAAPSTASTAPAVPRPRVALALSGGGARGAAHVGVLRALEELRVPVDLVVGTSMGAVVGGLYACGLSPDELERVLVQVDWAAAFEDRPARRDRTFRRKEDDRRFLFDLEVNVGGDAPTLPSGFRSGQNLVQILRRLTLRCATVQDFDRLAVPFRAVATDLQRQEAVVLADGDLVAALRASMAIPGFFSPVPGEDGRLLVDGGVVQNLPVETARELGADVILAADVTTPARPGDGSLLAVTSRTLDLLINANVAASRERADVLLVPDLGEAGLFSFAAAPRLVARGEEAVREKSTELTPLSLPAEEHAARLAHQRRTEPETLPSVDVLVVEGTRRVHPRQLTSRIRTRPGQPLDPDRLAEDVARLYGLGEFARVDARYEEQDGVGSLVIDSREKRRGLFVARFGLSLDGSLGDDASFGLLTSLLATQLDARGAEWRTDLQVGDLRLLATELYQPLDFRGRFFVAPHLGFRQEVQDFFDGGRRVAEYEVDSAVAGLDVGRALGKYGELRVGLLRGRVEARVETGAPTLPEAEDDLAGFHARLALDRLDNPVFPRSGTNLVVETFLAQPDLGSDVDYRSLVGAGGLFHTRGVHTVFAGLEAGWSWGGDLPVYDLFAIGGLLSLSGYDDRELRGNHYGVARAGYYQRLLDLPPALGGAVYFGGWLEAGNAWEGSGDVSFSDLRYAATAGLGIDTLAGPVLVAWGQGEDGGKLYLTLGRTF